MARKDIYHNLVRVCLEKEGWLITDDPLELYDKVEKIDYEIDLGAERLLCAEKGDSSTGSLTKIAVEIKSCLKLSFAHEFHGMLGQYLVYLEGLKELDAQRKLYLAIPQFAAEKLTEHTFLLRLIDTYQVKMLVFDTNNSEIISWKN